MPKKLNPSFARFNFFEALFKNTKQNTVLLMDSNGIVTEINTAFTEAFGYKDPEIIGKHTSILFTAADNQKGLPEMELKRVLETGESKDNNYLVHKSGLVTWVTGESIKVENDKGEITILKIIQDVHRQKEYESSIREINELNESILAGIEDVVILMNSEMKIIKVNEAFNKLFQLEADATTVLFSDLIKPYDLKEDLQNKIQSTINNRTGFFNTEVEIETPAGDKRAFNISCKPMKDNLNVLLVVHDITVQRSSDRQREDIIGFVAHELRNPLANIILCNDLMEDIIKENKPKEVAELLSRSKNNVMRLNKMITELYDATKAGSGNMQLEMGEFNFKDMIKDAIATIEVLQPEYKIVTKGKADFVVIGDRHRIIQVVTNYLSNGIKYSKGSDEVELTMQHDKKTVTVSVKDKGLGISKEQLPYIFNRFFRAEKTKNLEGVGLGLYLCSQIIKAHQGNVWVESEEGKGSTFYFSIPRTNL